MLKLERADHHCNSAGILDALGLDQVVLIRNATIEDADDLILAVAQALNLGDQLELQAGLAAIKGHRERIGRHFMSVNPREDYQFISAHSEGTRVTNMQLASLYRFGNTTDGGETVLLNTNDRSPM